MAGRDALNNAARVEKRDAAELKKQEDKWDRENARSLRKTAIDFALRMGPPDIVGFRTADSVISDADKLMSYMHDGKAPAKHSTRPVKRGKSK